MYLCMAVFALHSAQHFMLIPVRLQNTHNLQKSKKAKKKQKQYTTTTTTKIANKINFHQQHAAYYNIYCGHCRQLAVGGSGGNININQ